MSTSLWVSAVIPADEKYNKMLAIWNACKEIDVRPPDEVIDFFDDASIPNSGGYETVYSCYSNDLPDFIKRWDDKIHRSGVEIDLEKIPEKVKFIRCYFL